MRPRFRARRLRPRRGSSSTRRSASASGRGRQLPLRPGLGGGQCLALPLRLAADVLRAGAAVRRFRGGGVRGRRGAPQRPRRLRSHAAMRLGRGEPGSASPCNRGLGLRRAGPSSRLAAVQALGVPPRAERAPPRHRRVARPRAPDRPPAGPAAARLRLRAASTLLPFLLECVAALGQPLQLGRGPRLGDAAAAAAPPRPLRDRRRSASARSTAPRRRRAPAARKLGGATLGLGLGRAPASMRTAAPRCAGCARRGGDSAAPDAPASVRVCELRLDRRDHVVEPHQVVFGGVEPSSVSRRRACTPAVPAASSSRSRRSAGLASISAPTRPWLTIAPGTGRRSRHRRTAAARRAPAPRGH